MDKCIIQFEQVTEEHLVELKDRASWETLLNAVKTGKFKAVIEIPRRIWYPSSKVWPKMSFIAYIKKRSAKIKFRKW